MALKLYGSTQCPNTKRVRIMLEEMQVRDAWCSSHCSGASASEASYYVAAVHHCLTWLPATCTALYLLHSQHAQAWYLFTKVIHHGNHARQSDVLIVVHTWQKSASHVLQVPYEFVILDMASGEARQPWYLQKHPFGQIPALEDTETGATAFESRAIMRYALV